MGKHKKRFIDKKNAQTFHLVHRSQRDPLQADEDSSKLVLQEVQNDKELKRKQEQVKYGIYFDDDYDYTQHLKDVDREHVWEAVPGPSHDNKTNDRKVHFCEDDSKKGKVHLPPEALPSEYEEDVGLLNRAAPISGPRLDLDPDIVAAMDDDFNFDNPDNLLDDDFILQAQGEVPIREEEFSSEDEYSEEGDVDSDGPFDIRRGYFDDEDDDHMTFNSEGNKSRFTEYSISSSVMHRNKGLTLLDDRFEKMYEEYDDMEVGALDQDDIEGFLGENNEILNQALEEYEKTQKKLYFPDSEVPGEKGLEETGERESSEDEKDADELIRMQFEEPVREKWDCESILSTYSNLYNHPKLIDVPHRTKKRQADQSNGPIRLSQKTGIPLDVLPKPGPTKKQLERQEFDETRLPLVIESRKKGQKEMLEQKKERKMAVKTERRERRMEKKANKAAFKEEQKRQEKSLLNVQQNMQGVKIS